MHRAIALLQVLLLVVVFGAIGGAFSSFGKNTPPTFSPWGAGGGVALVLVALAIAWPFLRNGRFVTSTSGSARWLLECIVVLFLATGTSLAIFMYTRLPWMLHVVQVLVVVGALVVAGGVVVSFIGNGNRDA